MRDIVPTTHPTLKRMFSLNRATVCAQRRQPATDGGQGSREEARIHTSQAPRPKKRWRAQAPAGNRLRTGLQGKGTHKHIRGTKSKKSRRAERSQLGYKSQINRIGRNALRPRFVTLSRGIPAGIRSARSVPGQCPVTVPGLESLGILKIGEVYYNNC